MAKCEYCGNDYDKVFTLTIDGKSHTYDCFECAIESHAPRCGTCNVRILGHGVEAGGGKLFCCANCARKAGVQNISDRV